MITNRPRAAAMPPRRAAPYPFSATGTTRAPMRSAIWIEPSELPLSATTISPSIASRSSADRAASMHAPSVPASFRQGRTIDSSIAVAGASGWRPPASASRRPRWVTDMSFPIGHAVR